MKTKTTKHAATQKKNGSELQSHPEQQCTEKKQTATAAVTAASAAAEASPLSQVNFEQRKFNRSLGTQDVLARLQRWIPRAYELAEVVGSWVWVTFDKPQPRELTSELAQLGFHWNPRRKVWQHPCGVFQGEPVNPRAKYQSFHPADQVAA